MAQSTVNQRLLSIFPRIQILCKSFLPTEAEDLAQDVAVRLLARPETIPDAPSYRWIASVVRHAAIDVHRSKQRIAQYVDVDLSVDITGSVGERGSESRFYIPAANASRIESDVYDRIRSALSSLTPCARQSLLLLADGCSYEQISAVTRCKIGTVRSRIHYARSKMRQLLADCVMHS